MRPSRTYELRVVFRQHEKALQTKTHLMAWLSANGIHEFVEGSVEGLNEDFNYDDPSRDMYSEFGGDLSPISIFKFSLEHLEGIQAKVANKFKDKIVCEIHTMETQVWTDGWKESFEPFETKKFYVYPPWKSDSIPKNKIPLEVEPGMAFGTGQHATTKLCLSELESTKLFSNIEKKELLDVGTGTGILSIGAKKLGWGRVVCTDIDIDSVTATKNNAEQNSVELEIFKASVPHPSLKKGLPATYDLVVANILAVVLRKIIKDLATATKSGGALIMSGLLVEEKEEITALAHTEGLELYSDSELDGWSCICLRRK